MTSPEANPRGSLLAPAAHYPVAPPPDDDGDATTDKTSDGLGRITRLETLRPSALSMQSASPNNSALEGKVKSDSLSSQGARPHRRKARGILVRLASWIPVLAWSQLLLGAKDGTREGPGSRQRLSPNFVATLVKDLNRRIYGKKVVACGIEFAEIEELAVQIGHETSRGLIEQGVGRQADDVPTEAETCSRCSRPPPPNPKA